MKLFFVGSSCYILYLMKIRYRSAASCIFQLIADPDHVSDQRMTLPSTPSRLNISSLPASFFPSSSTTSSPLRKSYGHFPFGWKRLLFSLNYSCFNARGKQRLSRRIIWPHWGHTELFTSLIGYTGMLFASAFV